ncbi:hypothetical protein [Cesiribacter sp. SM1]|uniref:hypothetical protein n=1 Tax=Cesiribacter sp. SM1 TaxID=2861196 RepID=UPI001CD68C5F|nr:hypothetical protein [Cesiribacter sp. SM1]
MRFQRMLEQGCLLAALLTAMASCTAPRSIINSGKVTAPGQFKVGFNYGGNIATEPLSELDDIARTTVDAVTNRDSVFFDEQIDVFARALTAYAIDPVGPAFDVYVRYGIAPRFDAGYKYASGAHVIDGMYQFMGSTGTPQDPGPRGLYGSVGLQYSGQNLNIGDQFYLDRINNLLRFNARRRDLVVPLIFSTSFGPEEEIGSIAFGVVYNHTFINYGFEPGEVFRRVGGNRVERIESLSESNNFSSFGAFINGRFGYKFIYVLPALTLYYQNYGTYKLLEGREYSFKGVTIIPSIGLQARFGGRNRR